MRSARADGRWLDQAKRPSTRQATKIGTPAAHWLPHQVLMDMLGSGMSA